MPTTDGSLSLSSDEPGPSSKSDKCQVCAQTARGNHFGALVCRACAAYFRRAILGNFASKACRCKSIVPFPGKRKIIKCKKCRLEQCLAAGMTDKKIQLNRDLKSSLESSPRNTSRNRKLELVPKNASRKIPSSIEVVLGRPHFVLFLNFDVLLPTKKPTLIDVSSLLEKASAILNEKPVPHNKLNGMSCLERMTFALEATRKPNTGKIQRLKTISKEDSMRIMENEYLSIAKWFTYCDEYQKLPHYEKIQVLQCAWQLWSRLEKTAMTAEMRLSEVCDSESVMVTNEIVLNPEEVEIDVSWFTNFSRNEILYFYDSLEREFYDEVLKPLIKLKPTSTELTYMLIQMCFQYAGKIFQGNIMETSERLNSAVSNELHNYYVQEKNMPRYCGRLSQLLKINQLVVKKMQQRMERQRLARILNVFTVDITHPKFFNGF